MLGQRDSPYPKDPDILKAVRIVNSLSVVNLLRVVIHYWKCSESLHFVLIYYVLSSESLCVVNSLQSSKFTTESDSVRKTVRKGPLGRRALCARGCLASSVPEWDSTENRRFYSFEPYTKPSSDTSWLSGTGDSQRDSRESIRANRFARIIRNWNPYFYSASGRFARITWFSDSRESPDSRESCESIRANHATKPPDMGELANLREK